ncbi:unnamed protein product [Moneuplotes crassus]|uniref:Uncharacterized protein n=1 Tax=Euplotes crassus TaxID=5936 RepID=A0AAD1UKR5_EUPCR|nr:unnamed protein product [Moneuplotes crassus]
MELSSYRNKLRILGDKEQKIHSSRSNSASRVHCRIQGRGYRRI